MLIHSFIYSVNVRGIYIYTYTYIHIYTLYIYIYTLYCTFYHYFRGNLFTFIETIAVLCQQQPHFAKFASVDYIKADLVMHLYDVSPWSILDGAHIQWHCLMTVLRTYPHHEVLCDCTLYSECPKDFLQFLLLVQIKHRILELFLTWWLRRKREVKSRPAADLPV